MSLTPEEEQKVRVLIAQDPKIISDLESEVELNGDEVFPVEDGSGTFACSINDVKDFVIDQYNPDQASATTRGIALLRNPIMISNNVSDANNDIDFSAGNFTFSDNSAQSILTSALTKRLDSGWTAGTNQGGLFSGSKANSTTYHCFAIYNPTSSAVDCGFDTSLTAANIPAGYTKYRRVGSIITDGSGNIYAFTMRYLASGQASFVYTANLTAFTGASPTDGTDLTIITPTGLNAGAILSGNLNHSGGGDCFYKLKSKVQGDYIYAGTLGNVNSSRSTIATPIPIVTNATSQIQHGRDVGGGSCSIAMYLHGWVDYQL